VKNPKVGHKNPPNQDVKDLNNPVPMCCFHVILSIARLRFTMHVQTNHIYGKFMIIS